MTSLTLGTAAVIYSAKAAYASVFVFGWLLVLAGVMQVMHAYQNRTSSQYFLLLLAGITRVTVGSLLVLYPTSGADALTMVLTFYLLVAGLYRTFGSIELRFPGWRWSEASGLVSLALAFMLETQWPASGMLGIGLAIGIDLIVYGQALLMLVAAAETAAGVPATRRKR
jgi:uncharacterized membrane protein HdeD (DUF308 family)